MSDSSRSEKIFSIGVILAIVLGLYFSSRYSYLLFHSLIEITTISIAFTLFILTWNTRKYLANNYLRLLGIGYAFISLIDLLHTLAYKGMNVFHDFGANLPTQLWIAARYLQAVTLVSAPLFLEREVDNRAIFGGYAAAVTALVVMVYSGNFPDCFIEGKGLTAFKISSEYVISALLLASLYLLYRKRLHFNDMVFFLTASSIACTALSEISFTAYVSVYGFTNLLGHFAKLAAFYLIYRAILVTGLKEPFSLIFRDLKQAEESLRQSQDTLEATVEERTAELRVSEEKFRSLIDKVQAAIVLHDGQGHILSSNPLAQELLGLSADQLLGKVLIDPDWHFLREDGSVMPVAEYPVSLVLAKRLPLRGYMTGISRSDRDEVTWALVNAEPEYDEAGEILRVIVSFVDISEQRRTEEAMHRLNRELRAISNCNQILMRAVDEQTLLNNVCRIVCDEAGYRMAWVGYAENDDAKTIRPVAWAGTEDGYLADANITWADTERGRGPSGTAIRNGVSSCFQDFATDTQAAPWCENALRCGYRSSISLPLKDESVKTFGVLNIYSTKPNAFTPDEMRLLEELTGDLAFGIMVLRSRIERKQAEDVLRISEGRYRMAEAIGHVGNWEYNLQTSKFWGSDEAKRIYGFDLEKPNFTPDEVENCIPERERVHQALVDLIEAGKPYNMEFEIHPIDSSEPRIITSIAKLERDEHGDPLKVVGVIQDVTKRKRAEESLRTLNAKLEQRVRERTAELSVAKERAEDASRAKSTFLSSMSHELRTPLNAILGYAQILKLQNNLTDRQRQHLEIMRVSGEHLLTLINDILDVGKIEAERMELEESSFNLPALLAQSFNITAIHAQSKDLSFQYETEPSLPESVRGDERKLKQILLNLLSNAVKYTRRGEVTLRAGYDHAIGLLRCEVKDTGVGIASDKLETIFEPFVQLVDERSVREGTGLGLTISKRLVTLMGGRITVESGLGKGSTFRVEVPLPIASADGIAVEKARQTITGYKGERKMILVVDDDITNASMLVTMLEPLGFEMAAAGSGREALDLAILQMPDLVVLDLVMPEMDGLALAKEIRLHWELAETRIIGISATVTESSHRDEFIAACDDFVAKPVELDKLLDKIGAQLRIVWETTLPGLPIAEARTQEREVFTLPPPEEVSVLHELAKRGDMRKIETWAMALEERDNRFSRFAGKLLELARGFKAKAILSLIEDHKEETK